MCTIKGLTVATKYRTPSKELVVRSLLLDCLRLMPDEAGDGLDPRLRV